MRFRADERRQALAEDLRYIAERVEGYDFTAWVLRDLLAEATRNAGRILHYEEEER